MFHFTLVSLVPKNYLPIKSVTTLQLGLFFILSIDIEYYECYLNKQML